MIEKDFQPWIVNSINKRGGWAYKLPDDMGGNSFSLKRPFDLICSVRSKSVAIEVKLLKGYQAFGLRHFQEHQPLELSKHMASGGRSFVFLIVWEPRDTRLLIFDWQWLSIRLNEGSIKKPELAGFDFINAFKKDFELENWFNSIKTPHLKVRL